MGDFKNARFNGDDYVPGRDDPRLRTQIEKIFDLMRDASWRTLDEISVVTGAPPASVSAQLRHLRKKRFGEHEVDKRHRGEEKFGLYEYRLRAKASPSPVADVPLKQAGLAF